MKIDEPWATCAVVPTNLRAVRATILLFFFFPFVMFDPLTFWPFDPVVFLLFLPSYGQYMNGVGPWYFWHLGGPCFVPFQLAG